MKKIIPALLVGLIFNISALIAQTADITKGCLPLTVKFQAPAGYSTYIWDFKDGTAANIETPSHNFSKAGIYDVSFQEIENGPVIGTVRITVLAKPTLKIKLTDNVGCSPLNVKIEDISVIDTSIKVLSKTWSYGDGESDLNASSISHTYTSNSNNISKFSPALLIETQYTTCKVTAIFTDSITILPKPVANYTTNPQITATCNSSLGVTFNNNSTGVRNLTYSWKLANGTTYSSSSPPLQTFTKASEIVSLLVDYPNTVGCTSIKSSTVSVGAPVASIISPTGSICKNTSIGFKNSVSGNYLYTWQIGTSKFYTDSVNYHFEKAGNQVVKLTVTSSDFRCSTSVTKNILVDTIALKLVASMYESCVAPFNVSYTATKDTNYQYIWNLYDGKTFFSDTTLNNYYLKKYNPINSTNYSVSVIAKSKINGCSDTAHVYTTFSPPSVNIYNVDFFGGCIPLNVKLYKSVNLSDGDKIKSEKWIFGDSLEVVKNNNFKQFIDHVYNKDGDFYAKLEITTKKGCKATSDSTLVKVGKNISNYLDFTATPTQICVGHIPVVNITNTWPKIDSSYFLLDNDTINMFSFSTSLGQKDLALKAYYNGCETKILKENYINIKGSLAGSVRKHECTSPLQYEFRLATNSPDSITSLVWDFGDSTFATDDSVSHKYKKSGNYNVKLVTINSRSGCENDTLKFLVTPRVVKAEITMDSIVCYSTPTTLKSKNSVDASSYYWYVNSANKILPYIRSDSVTGQFYVSGKDSLNMVAQDVNGCKDTASASFRTYKMYPSIVMDKNRICLPSLVNFDGNLSKGDTAITNWSWNFGNNHTSTKTSDTSSYFQAPQNFTGTYNVKLTLKDTLGCYLSLDTTITYYKPSTNISLNKSQLCEGDSVKISTYTDSTSNNGYLDYKWDFGNKISSNSRSNVILYDSVKAYNIKLIYTEKRTGCTDSAFTSVDFQSYPKGGFQTSIDTISSNRLCDPLLVTYTDTSKSEYGLAYDWKFTTFGPSYSQPIISTSTSKIYTNSFTQDSLVISEIVRTPYGCADTTYRRFFLYKPVGTFEISKNQICKGDIVTFDVNKNNLSGVVGYDFDFGDGYAQKVGSPKDTTIDHRYHYHPKSGKTIAQVTFYGKDKACPNTISKDVNIYQVIADFERLNGDSTQCFKEGTFKLKNTSHQYSSLSWDFGDGTTSNDTLINHLYANPGTYNVTLNIVDNVTKCVDTIVKPVFIYPNPNVSAMGDTVCQSSSATLYIINPLSTSNYNWYPDSMAVGVNTSQMISSVKNTSQYSVIETNSYGCKDTTFAVAYVVEPSTMKDWDTSVIVGDFAYLPTVKLPFEIFTWNPTDSLSCSNCENPLARPLYDKTYQLTVTDSLNCFNQNINYKITVHPETFIKLPTTFTPNGDGHNDILYINGWGVKEVVSFQIFNRWGQIIFESNDIKHGWDGKYNGNVQNSDMYVYKVRVKNWRNEEIFEEGYVDLMY